ncbi:MAG: hypothetical protein AAF609_14245 [Cyanobacteria bacterium P01_C01_bin.120]
MAVRPYGGGGACPDGWGGWGQLRGKAPVNHTPSLGPLAGGEAVSKAAVSLKIMQPHYDTERA